MIWLFDLDNTLHNASLAIFPKISANMNAFLARQMKRNGSPLSADEANRLRVEYWKRYGATLPGVSRTHNRKAKDFLRAAHQFDDLSSLVSAEKGLPALFEKLPGKKVLLTNSAYRYSEEILKLLGLYPCFDRHIAIESMRVFGCFEPKPSRKFFRKLPAILKTPLRNCVLVEDNIRILKTARAMGMKTVLVTQYLNADHYSEHFCPDPFKKKQIGRPPYVDLKISSVRRLEHHLKRFH